MRVGRIDRPPFSVRGQIISVSLRNGKTYSICSESQMEAIKEQAQNEIIHNLSLLGDFKDETKRMEETKRQMDEWQAKCPYATLKFVFSLMTPQEIEEWKDKYRYQGVWS